MHEMYKNQIAQELMKEFNLANVMQVSKLTKISINSGIGSFRDNREAVDSFLADFVAFAGQKPFVRKARLSIAGFKIKQNDVVGYAVTLRGDKMWAFLDKFINIALPRVRDFRGVSESSFDKNGNYSLGIKEHVIFPEVNANTTKGIRSLQVSLVFNSNNVELNRALLTKLGMPFRKK
jgi:large subunit ribosomal protein L5